LFLTIIGVGITSDLALTQTFIAVFGSCGCGTGVIQFKNSATAGDPTVFSSSIQASVRSGATHFFDTSSAGSGAFISLAVEVKSSRFTVNRKGGREWIDGPALTD
jgi:hypothetical protein